MGITAQEYAKRHRVDKRKIKYWFDAGYLGEAKRGDSGAYDIPEDTPVPYKADSRVSKLPTFWKQLLDAAQRQQSIFPSMYPKLQSGTVERFISEFSEAGWIRVAQTQSGAKYLELTPSGHQYMETLKANGQEKIFEKVNKVIATGCTLMQAFLAVYSIM